MTQILELSAVLLIFLLSLYIILKDFRFSVFIMLLFSVLLHKELFSFYRWDLLPIRAFMLAMFTAGVLRFFNALIHRRLSSAGVRKNINDPVVILLILLWAVRGLSIYNSQNLQSSVFLFAFFTTVVIFAIFLKNYTYSLKIKYSGYINYFIVISFFLCLFGIVQYFYHTATGKVIGAFWVIPGNIPRVGSLFWDVNHYGAFLAALLPLSALQFWYNRKLSRKLFYGLSAVLMSVSLYYTSSRSAWIIGGVTAVFYIGFTAISRYKWHGAFGILIIGLLVLSPFMYLYAQKGSAFREKIKHSFNYRIDSFDSHFYLLKGAYQVFEKYPLLGGGYGSFFEHFSKTEIAPVYFGRDPAALNTRVPAHTIWGELISETGVLGLSIYILLILVIIGTLLYSGQVSESLYTRALRIVMASVIVGWMVAGIFYSYNTEFFWILVLFYYFSSFEDARIPLDNVLAYIVNRKTVFAAVFIITGILIFLRLGANHLIPWDEAIYAKIAKNIVETGNYTVLNWFPGKVWYEKPPLFMWLVSGLMRVIGFNSWAVKLPSAIAGLLTVLLVFRWLMKKYSLSAALIGALSLSTTVHFLYYSRIGMTDVLCAFFITSALLSYYSTWGSGKQTYFLFISGVFVGLGAMTKGAVGLMPLAVIFIWELLCIAWKKELTLKPVLKRLGIVSGVSILIFLPWHIYIYSIYGTSFLDNYLKYHIFERAVQEIEDKGRPLFWYIEVLRVSMRIWFAALLLSIPYTLYRVLKRDKTMSFLVVWGALIFTVFSAAKSKLVWYIIPVYIPLSLIIGISLSSYYELMSGYIRLLKIRPVKLILYYCLTVFSLFYLFLIRGMVYTDDNTGSQARLLMMKDSVFGREQFIYVDRIEEPLVMYYTEGQYKIIDFNPKKPERVPNIPFNERLVMLTKKGRYSESIPKYDYPPDIVSEDGDYILWYMESGFKEYTSQLNDVILAMNVIENKIITVYGGNPKLLPDELGNEYSALMYRKYELESRLAQNR